MYRPFTVLITQQTKNKSYTYPLPTSPVTLLEFKTWFTDPLRELLDNDEAVEKAESVVRNIFGTPVTNIFGTTSVTKIWDDTSDTDFFGTTPVKNIFWDDTSDTDFLGRHQ